MSDAKMNAKDRRKLKRAQELAAKEATAVEVVVPEPVAAPAAPAPEKATPVAAKPTPVATKAKKEEPAVADVIAAPSVTKTKKSASAPKDETDATGKTAKERRLEKRAAARETPTEAPADEASGMNAKARRLAQRAAQRAPATADGEAPAKPETKPRPAKRKLPEKENPNEKRIHLTLFLGQLPFSATEDKIRKHFHEAGELKVRMATDKKTGKFKGTAFIEVKDSKALGAALSRHHSLLDGRRINVELTANGGGKKSELRTSRIKDLREKQSAKQIEKVRALLQKNVDNPECKLTQDDVDERMTDFLSWFDYETAKVALEEFNRCVNETVINRRAFFMGILKRFRTTDGVEDRPAKKPRTNDGKPAYGNKPAFGNKPAYGSKPGFKKPGFGASKPNFRRN
ncbi:hypothetical protein SPRG_08320 [Saprolegnia parasitica CBS 223.65]|uniref:RRM domain-containing protein n=1 Tax=Saprolegnia parasitica (strain CBS 223.65) TaxID=695850 RepID=A0A067CAR8_SAPPC|nr:hypothetical protein SPRG_08320 [Saprolegnia parasitica CBS 223.65]KDO26245.1 hypothetical protein SPRG_08320 [Saprolegnia parasitica CBS 223.65]|eukprot:XP_012202954.1 hypothetical protein SPRG_08320 [Saprolegnia parasitica CBS 223.65]